MINCKCNNGKKPEGGWIAGGDARCKKCESYRYLWLVDEPQWGELDPDQLYAFTTVSRVMWEIFHDYDDGNHEFGGWLDRLNNTIVVTHETQSLFCGSLRVKRWEHSFSVWHFRQSRLDARGVIERVLFEENPNMYKLSHDYRYSHMRLRRESEPQQEGSRANDLH